MSTLNCSNLMTALWKSTRMFFIGQEVQSNAAANEDL
jgi:hypothetical protein